MVVINNNSGLTEAHYSGTNLTEIYVGQHLVWPINPTPPIVGNKVTYVLSGQTQIIPCNETNIVSYQEIMIDLEDEGYDMRDISGITDVALGECVGEIHPLCFAECYSLSSITMCDTVTEIDYQAFYDCNSLSSLTLSSSITKINDSVFGGDYELSTLSIPSGVTEIGINSFYDCLSLLNITIPSGVTRIGDSAFRASPWTPKDQYQYRKMNIMKDNRRVFCLATTPPTIGTTVFAIMSGDNDIATYKIYVPSESLEAYKTAQGWSTYADRILPISQ